MPLQPHSVRGARSRASVATLSLALGLAATLISAPISSGAEVPPAPGTTAVPGASITGERWLTERTIELTVDTPSFTVPAKVEVMLPVGYSTAQDRKWPVTYYLSGTTTDQTTLRTKLQGETLMSAYPSIVVSPSANTLAGVKEDAGVEAPGGGNVGYWSDWDNYGAGGPPKYETFVTEQLIPLIEANFNALNDRGHRAVLGESMGGYGTLMLAARHPDLFAAASSLSGAVDTNWVPGAAVVTASPVLDTAIPDSIYGPRTTHEVNWRGHNPVDLAQNLRAVDVQLYTGKGIPAASELDDPLMELGCTLEAGIVQPETLSLHNTLVGLGIPHKFTAYDWGCHTSAMFKQQIADTLPRFMEVFAKNTPVPATFDYRSVGPSFSVFGWSIAADPNRAAEFLNLRSVSNTGFTITGSGTTQVTTPPIFKGNQAVTVLINGTPTVLRPDSNGRITVTVDLGRPNQVQQYTIGAITNLRTSVISFLR